MGRKRKGTKSGQGQAGKRRKRYKRRSDAKWAFLSYRSDVLAQLDAKNPLVLTASEQRFYLKKAKNEFTVEMFLKHHKPLARCFGVLEHADSGSEEPEMREPDWRWAINTQTVYGIENCRAGERCHHCMNWSRMVTSDSLAFRREALSPVDRRDRPVFRREGVSPRQYPGLDPCPPSP